MANSTSTSALQIYSGKGTTTYFTFKSNPNVGILKNTVDTVKYCLDLEGAELFLEGACNAGTILYEDGKRIKDGGDAFKVEAATNSMTLVETFKAILELCQEKGVRNTAPMEGPSRLAALMVKLAPNCTGQELCDHLKELVDASMPEAIALIDKAAARTDGNGNPTGRNEAGYVLLREQKKGKAAVNMAGAKTEESNMLEEVA